MLAPNPELVQFGEWAPDISPLDTGVSANVLNVVPRADGYGPFKALTAFSGALAAACRGFFFARRTDGTVAVFAGTSTKLYLLNNTTLAWGDVSAGGGSYSALAAGENWSFAQFGSIVIAVQSGTAPQSFTLGSSSEFAALGGSPPTASHVAVINRFVVLSGLSSNVTRVHWSDIDAPTTWSAGTGLCDFQDLPDGGTVYGVSGGDNDGYIFQDASIRRMVFAPGSPAVFEIIRIATQDGVYGRYSIINAGDRTFFYSPQGFKVIAPGGYPMPIGKERVDRTFIGELDRNNLQLFLGATDPTQTRVYWAYKSTSGQAGLFDKLLCYDWSIGERGRWSRISSMGEFLAALARPGITLEGLDAIAPGVISISNAANNGSGLIRLTVSSTSGWSTGQIKAVSGVVGTTEANGNWTITVISGTTIDLQGSTFTNAYVSGGIVGGSLDALPFSLDDVSTAAVSQLAAISSAHKVGFFTGDNLEATMETPEQNGRGNRVLITGLRPMTDADGGMCCIGGRPNAQADVSYTDETAINDHGVSPQRVDTRLARAKLRIPAAESWTYAMGVEPEFRVTGQR